MSLIVGGPNSRNGGAISYVEDYWPTEGQVITTRQNAQNGTIILEMENGEAIEELTLIWPPDNVSQIGQIRRIAVLSGSIANLVVPDTTFLNGQPSMMSSDFMEFQKIRPNTWMRML